MIPEMPCHPVKTVKCGQEILRDMLHLAEAMIKFLAAQARNKSSAGI
jgi:hypothetical protein